MRVRWLRYLLAILAGNALYFAVRPYLPGYLQHRAFQMDAGLALDFLFCLAAYFLLRRWLLKSSE